MIATQAAGEVLRRHGWWRIVRRWVPAVALAAAALVVGCGTDAESAPRQKLLVYYGNETASRAAQSENYAALLKVLDASTNPLAARAAASIRTDAERFPLLVQRDVAALKSQARRLHFDLAVFTNALAFRGHYLLFRGASGVEETRELPPIPATTSTILATSPLSRPQYFRAALFAVAALYPPHSLDIILIANGHGGSDMALIPRVNSDLSRVGAALAMKEMLESDDQGVPPDWALPQGTSKVAFWRIIAAVSAAKGVRFPFVFREACKSGLWDFAEFWAVPASVGLIADSALDDLNGWDFDYTRILGRASPGSDWIAALAAGLSNAGVHVETRGTAWIGVTLLDLRRIPIFFYFVPLLIWGAWEGAGLLRARRRAAPKPAATSP
jgi:hypothetical protein